MFLSARLRICFPYVKHKSCKVLGYKRIPRTLPLNWSVQQVYDKARYVLDKLRTVARFSEEERGFSFLPSVYTR
jgi:hypothetical protein